MEADEMRREDGCTTLGSDSRGTTTWVAALAVAPGQPLVLREISVPQIGPTEVMVSVAATGVCHTDLLWWQGGLPRDPYGFSVVLGHETAGTVVATGSAVSDVAVGERVVVALTHHCGRCPACETGHPMLCAHRSQAVSRFSSSGRPVLQGFGVGGFAEAVVVPASSVVRVPDNMPLPLAALLGCALATGLGAVLNIARVETGADVVVIGAGAVGAAVVAGARLAGAATIVVVEPDPDRRRLAETLGATLSFASIDELQSALGDPRFHFSFEVAGAAGTIRQAVTLCAPGGTCTLIGVPPGDADAQLPWLDFIAGQKRLLGCITGDIRPHQDLPRYAALYERGLLPLEPFLGATFPLRDINKAFAAASARSGLRAVIINGEQERTGQT